MNQVEILRREIVKGKGGVAYRIKGVVDGRVCSIDIDRQAIDDLSESEAVAKVKRQLVGCARYHEQEEAQR